MKVVLPEFAVRMTIMPLDVAVPSPVARLMAPPVSGSESPASTMISPPVWVLDFPMLRTMSPPRPPVADPVAMVISMIL